MLRQRRLVDVSKVDTSVELFGQKYDCPIVISPTGGHKGYHPDGESGVARAAKVGNHLQILSTQATTSVEDTTAARGAPIWFQLYATNKFEVASHHVKRAERAGCVAVAVTVDRSGGRNQETLFRLQRTDTRTCRDCHDNSNITAAQRSKPAYEGVDLSGLNNIQSSSMSWDYIKRLRDQTKMKMVLKGIMTWEDAKLAAESRHRRHHRVEPRRPQRGRRRLDDRGAAGDHPGRGLDAGADRFRFPPRRRRGQGAVHGRQGRSAWAGPISGASAPSASRASSACSSSCASRPARWSSRWARRRSSI